ncbi:kinase-like domain-containing protein [Phaeosphaeria sp. MPI-PUGE-AT-0046c]|nr:kinase-like domain-containing protein [Phaeosphaeria sp. MPI-PUGE-AT-0046c]
MSENFLQSSHCSSSSCLVDSHAQALCAQMPGHSADQAAATASPPTTMPDTPRKQFIRPATTTVCDPAYDGFIPEQHIEIANRNILPFRHEKIIGRGSSAVIEMVSHKSTHERFALKVFRRCHSRQWANDKHAFENEVSIMRRLSSHAHVIKVRESYTCGRELLVLMSPVASDGDLSAYLARAFEAPMTAEQGVVLNRAFGCLASGLAYIHKHTIRHKDIKPQNILIHDGRVIYTDFGIAFDADQQDTTTCGYTNTFTRRYCAPEVQDQTSRNRKSDVFSLACVYLEMLDVLEPKFGLRAEDKLPYFEKLDSVRQRLHEAKVTGRARKELFRICYDMLEPSLADRIDTGGVLSRIHRLGSSKDNPETGLFCDECSVIAECNDTVTEEELVADCTVLSLDATPTTDAVPSESETASATKVATKKRKKKRIISSIPSSEESEPTISQRAFSSRTPRYYCTTCGEHGHDSSSCPNTCWACGELYHKSFDCPNTCWTCDSFGHYARDCPNICDACGKIGHPTDDCPNRCWTCGEVGHFARDCQDACFVCGRLGHGTQICKGKCHKCGKIGHWRRDCDAACGECGDLRHGVAQCPNKKTKKTKKKKRETRRCV